MKRILIKDVAEHYSQMGNHVEILTSDQGLKAYEPAAPPVRYANCFSQGSRSLRLIKGGR